MYRTVIVEDEASAQDHLSKLISRSYPDLQVVKTLASVNEGIEWFRSNDLPDLIFMDIHLSDGISFDLLEEVDIDCPIIYTTAYDQYAIKAFKTSGIDYLLKPITNDDLETAVEKFRDLKNKQSKDWAFKNLELIKEYTQIPAKYPKRFLLRSGNQLTPVKTSHIAYFYRSEIVFAKTFNGKPYPMDESLNQLQQQLDPDEFLRIHRQLLINVEAIDSLIPYKPGQLQVSLTPAFHEPIYLSQERSSWLRQFLKEF